MRLTQHNKTNDVYIYGQLLQEKQLQTLKLTFNKKFIDILNKIQITVCAKKEDILICKK